MLPFFVSRNPKTHKRHKKSTKPKRDKALRLCVDTQENTKGTKTDIEFVCFVCFREIKKGHKAPVGVVTVKQAGSSCASSSLFLPLRSRGLLASR